MKFSTKSLHTKLVRHLREWHRKLGIIAAFFLIFLSLTGIALNHTETLALAHKPITNTWLLAHYGIKAPNDVRFYPVQLNNKKHYISVAEHYAWLNEILLVETEHDIVSAGATENYLFVFTGEQLFLFNLKGELLDQLDGSMGLPENITKVAVLNQSVFVTNNQKYWQVDSEFLDWQPVSSPENLLTHLIWITPDKVTSAVKNKVIQHYQSQYLTLERIIVDAHSGRIFGLFGVLFMDAIGVLLILLSVSGIYIWVRYTRAKR